ncbi:TetR/AcrR family transcriptional regulator [Acetobacter sp. DsW_063]|uniref:TetR/AcrR family transcriptional regulator n=1 Tax=Acetobacter sp. DsW_063 TaxID=1514894 RepID=UPI000A3B06F5|nr:TetR/AcrR family transcriptional regulator [Acetobacter sp. DsW_063]OUJ10993.1 TetR family transcriptional regulator [Acetobacter sp. DsW_063]
MKIGRPKEVPDDHILSIARRCFLERGGSISAADIAREIGVSHTTLFNRFGSKQGLMLAALGAPKEIQWIATLESGPDNRPIREQIIEIACKISAFFEDLHAGFTVLQGSGIATDALCSEEDPEESAPARAFRALTEWIGRAQDQGKLARSDAQVLASTLLGVLHNRAFSSRICGDPDSEKTTDATHVANVVTLLWDGIKPPR